MKIVLLTTYYGPFLENFYTRFNTSHFGSYQEHLIALMAEFFGDSGCTWHHLNAAGHDCSIIIANNYNLQKQWAEENNVVYSEDNWQKEIPLAQIKKWAPDIFYNEGVFEYFGEFNREVLKYAKKSAAWMSTPFSSNLDLSGMSLILSSTPAFVEQFKKQGLHAAYLLPAFDVRVLEKFPQQVEKDISFSFVGGWSHVHINRKEAIKRLVQDTPVKIWGYGYLNQPRYSRRSFKYYRQLFFPENRKVLERYQGEAWGLDMYGIYRRSLMTFNIHESLLQGLVGNMRMFEATGMGTMMLNEDAPNLPEMFVPGKEVETYRSLDEAVEKVNYFLAHPEKALEIGKNAQHRTSRDYNYTLFAEKLLDHFKQILS